MKGNREIIATLNRLLAEELTAINQYVVHSEMGDNWGYGSLHKAVQGSAIDEMKHAEKLIGRILFLESMPTVSELNALKLGKDVKEIILDDLGGENDAIMSYNQAIIQATELRDAGTRELMEGILEDEERHLDFEEAHRGRDRPDGPSRVPCESDSRIVTARPTSEARPRASAPERPDPDPSALTRSNAPRDRSSPRWSWASAGLGRQQGTERRPGVVAERSSALTRSNAPRDRSSPRWSWASAGLGRQQGTEKANPAEAMVVRVSAIRLPGNSNRRRADTPVPATHHARGLRTRDLERHPGAAHGTPYATRIQ